MEFIPQVQIWSFAGRFLFAAGPMFAAQLLESKRAIVEVVKRERVRALRLVEEQGVSDVASLHLQAGSYSIRKDTESVPGHLIYSHKRTWDANDMKREISRENRRTARAA